MTGVLTTMIKVHLNRPGSVQAIWLKSRPPAPAQPSHRAPELLGNLDPEFGILRVLDMRQQRLILPLVQ